MLFEWLASLCGLNITLNYTNTHTHTTRRNWYQIWNEENIFWCVIKEICWNKNFHCHVFVTTKSTAFFLPALFGSRTRLLFSLLFKSGLISLFTVNTKSCMTLLKPIKERFKKEKILVLKEEKLFLKTNKNFFTQLEESFNIFLNWEKPKVI